MVELHGEAEDFQAVDEAADEALLVALIEMQGTQVLVVGSVGQEVIRDRQEGVAVSCSGGCARSAAPSTGCSSRTRRC